MQIRQCRFFRCLLHGVALGMRNVKNAIPLSFEPSANFPPAHSCCKLNCHYSVNVTDFPSI
jgi:hypothetical protein